MNDTAFEKAHMEWLGKHAAARKGESKKRLLARHGDKEIFLLEHIWWPIFGSLEHLHPQFEFRDAFGRERVLSFAYVRPPHRICIVTEDDPGADALAADLWVVIKMSYEDMSNCPNRCRQLMANLLRRLFPERLAGVTLTPYEKEALRLAAGSARPVTPSDVSHSLHICGKTARTILKSLVEKRLLVRAGGGKQRTRSYRPCVEPNLLLDMAG
ncbi:hypothetical protein [Paenibacillus thermotolerans]|uniref:hypothetical protein n=1 Tax=Paenibacillus thermotolerans TaxID=3027807 RepID=UPI0023676E2F|nr:MULTISPECIES: hypothetical protein [unclassified Paenibacillus]